MNSGAWGWYDGPEEQELLLSFVRDVRGKRPGILVMWKSTTAGSATGDSTHAAQVASGLLRRLAAEGVAVFPAGALTAGLSSKATTATSALTDTAFSGTRSTSTRRCMRC